MVAGPLTGIFDFGAAPMDKLIIYLQTSVGGAAAPLLRICRYEYGSDDWSNAKLLATLQLPIRELMPALANPNLEYAEAKRRLLPGDAIDPARFGDFMNLLQSPTWWAAGRAKRAGDAGSSRFRNPPVFSKTSHAWLIGAAGPTYVRFAMANMPTP